MCEKTKATVKIILTLFIPLLIVYINFPKELPAYLTFAAIIVALFKEKLLKFYLPPQLKISLAEIPNYYAEVEAMLQWAWMFYDGERITDDELYTKPGGEALMKQFSERPEEIKRMDARFAKKYQARGQKRGQSTDENPNK